jgi:hypothetical protein
MHTIVIGLVISVILLGVIVIGLLISEITEWLSKQKWFKL